MAGCLLLAPPALADDECGPIVDNAVTCTSGGNFYTSGITYDITDDLTMVVDGVAINATGIDVDGIDIHTLLSVPITLTVETGAITTDGDLAEGIYVLTPADSTVTLSGSIATQGVRAYGIRIAQGATSTVTTSSTSQIVTQEQDAHGMFFDQTERTYARVSGSITTHGAAAAGIVSKGAVYADIVTYAGSSIATDAGYGIYVGDMISGTDPQGVNITVSGSIETGIDYAGSTYNSYAHGVYVYQAEYGAVAVTVSETGSIAIRHEFLGEQAAEVSGLTFTHDLPGTMGFLATALEVEIIEDSLTLIVRGEFAKGSEGEEFTGSFGLNWTL
jgi:hypothetical protein